MINVYCGIVKYNLLLFVTFFCQHAKVQKETRPLNTTLIRCHTELCSPEETVPLSRTSLPTSLRVGFLVYQAIDISIVDKQTALVGMDGLMFAKHSMLLIDVSREDTRLAITQNKC